MYLSKYFSRYLSKYFSRLRSRFLSRYLLAAGLFTPDCSFRPRLADWRWDLQPSDLQLIWISSGIVELQLSQIPHRHVNLSSSGLQIAAAAALKLAVVMTMDNFGFCRN